MRLPAGRTEADGNVLMTAPAASLWRVTTTLAPSYTVKHLISVALFEAWERIPTALIAYLSRGWSRKPWVAL